MKFIKSILYLILLVSSNSFYIYLGGANEQCYFRSIFKQERLLIEIQTPIISSSHRILLRVKAGNQTVISREIVNQVKITVPRSSNVIKNEDSVNEMEYETCLSLIVLKEQIITDITSQSQDESEQPSQKAPVPQGYIVHVKLMANFQHKLQNKKQSITNINYKLIAKISKTLSDINAEQVNLHQINEMKEQQTQNYLKALKNKVIMFSIIQILMILAFTLIQMGILRRYLNSMSIV